LSKFHKWWIKTRVISKKVFWPAFEQNCLTSNPKVNNKDLTKIQKRELKANNDAVNYLTSALIDDAFNLVTAKKTENNAHIMWQILMDKYEPNNNNALGDIQDNWAELAMKTKDDPEIFGRKLMIVNQRFAKVDTKN